MCGIVGFAGGQEAAPGRLEHRGCDIDKPRNLAKSVTVE